MAIDILIFGEALVEIMRPAVDQPLHSPGPFVGPFPSGAPFIFAVQAARLGAQVLAIGAVGADAFGQCLLDQLRSDRMDISGLRVMRDRATGVAFVAYAADGSRDFVFHVRDAAAGQITPDLLNPAQFDGLRVLHLMGSTLSISDEALATGKRAMALAKTAGAKFSFDPNLRPQLMPVDRARTVFAPFVEGSDVILPTAEEVQLLTGRETEESAVQTLFNMKADRLVIIKRGAYGATVFSRSGKVDVPGFVVEEVDPTGAGDCFDAGFLVQWLAGNSPVDAVRFANACGALAVTVRGPMAGAQPTAVVRSFITQHERDKHD